MEGQRGAVELEIRSFHKINIILAKGDPVLPRSSRLFYVYLKGGQVSCFWCESCASEVIFLWEVGQ